MIARSRVITGLIRIGRSRLHRYGYTEREGEIRRRFGPSFPANQFRFQGTEAGNSEETVSITFVEPDGTERSVQAEVGKHLLEIAHDNNIDLEGACGGELACSTCHLIFEQDVYDQLPPKEDDEEDMLDMALALTDT